MEDTAARRLGGIRNLTLQNDALLGGIGTRVRLRHGRKKRFRIWMARLVEQRARIGNFHQSTEIHDADAIGDMLHHRQVMGDEQVGQAELILQVLQQVDHLRRDRHVERRNRLVRCDEVGLTASARAMPIRCRWPPEKACG